MLSQVSQTAEPIHSHYWGFARNQWEEHCLEISQSYISNLRLMSRGVPMKQYLPTESIIIVQVALVSQIAFLLTTGRQRIKMIA